MRLARRMVAEALGTGLLVAAVVGSGIAATRLSPGEPGLQLLQNSIATGAVLLALIVVLQPVSAAFNPVVTLAGGLLGGRAGERAPVAALGALIGAQVAGGVAGAVLANLMFGLDAVSLSSHQRAGGPKLLAEVVATFGLVLVVHGLLRAGRGHALPYAVAGYIVAAYWFTSSTSFANPAVTVARALSDTFAGIAPSSVGGFVLAQLCGAVLAAGAVRYLFPVPAPDLADPADLEGVPT